MRIGEFQFDMIFKVLKREDGGWDATYKITYTENGNFHKTGTQSFTEKDAAIISASQCMGNDMIQLSREIHDAKLQEAIATEKAQQSG